MFTHPAHRVRATTPRGTRARPAGTAARAARRIQKRQLERSVSWTGPERLRCLWYRLRLTVREAINANLRMLEWQVTGMR
jgi:hypothetical protein